MSGDLSKQNWFKLALATPLIAGLTHLALQSLYSVPAPACETRDVSFKIVFDDRVGFPQMIRQSTIEKMLGPEYEIVGRSQPGQGRDSRDCPIQQHGGLLKLRIPPEANPAEIADRLEQLSRVKFVTFCGQDQPK